SMNGGGDAEPVALFERECAATIDAEAETAATKYRPRVEQGLTRPPFRDGEQLPHHSRCRGAFPPARLTVTQRVDVRLHEGRGEMRSVRGRHADDRGADMNAR